MAGKPLEVKVSLEGAEEAIRTLDRLGVDLIRIVSAPLDRGAKRAESELKEYPEPIAPGVWARWATAKVRAAFFAKLKKEKKPTVKGRGRYTRTMGLAQHWTTNSTRTAVEYRADIGTNMEYARWVQDEARQAGFHRGRFRTAQTIMRDQVDDVTKDVVVTFQRALTRYTTGGGQ